MSADTTEVDHLLRQHEAWLRARDAHRRNIVKANDARTIELFMRRWGSTRMQWTIVAAMRGEDVYGEVLHQSVRSTCAVRWGAGARLLSADTLLAMMEHANGD